jgi:hypothetical protein
VGAFALVVGAVLALAGTFLPLYRQVFDFPGAHTEFEMTAWGARIIPADVDVRDGTESVLYGLPMAVAAVLLVGSAVLVFIARTAVIAKVVAVSAATLLIGSVWTVGQLVLVQARPPVAETSIISISVGIGMWTLAAACVIALAGGVLVQDWPKRTAVPENDVVIHQFSDETDTPPLGFPVPEETPAAPEPKDPESAASESAAQKPLDPEPADREQRSSDS